MSASRAISGSLSVENRATGPRVWVAKYQTASGRKTRKVLGPAWAKSTGKRTDRGGSVWRVPDGPKPEGFLTPKQARDELERLLVAERAKPQTAVRHVNRTVQDAVDEWLHHREFEKECAETTMRDYRGTAKRDILPFFGASTPLRKVDQAKIEAFRRHLLDVKPTPRTAQKTLVLTTGVFDIAVKRGWIGLNPCVHVDAIRARRRKSAIGHVLKPAEVYAIQRVLLGLVDADDLPDDEFARFLRYDTERRLTTLSSVIVFAAFTGLRTGELRALRWEDIDFADGWVRVRRNLPSHAEKEKEAKGGEGRSVPLIKQAAKIAEDLSRRGYLDRPTDRVFPGPEGLPLEENAIRNALYKGMDLAGLGRLREKPDSPGAPDPFTAHDLRHTFGTLAAAVFPLRDVQAYLGHKDLQTTQAYLHHVPSHDHAAKLGNLIDEMLNPLAPNTPRADRYPGTST